MTEQRVLMFGREIRQAGLVTADEESIGATKMQALSELRERWCSTRGIMGGERDFVFFGECRRTVEEVAWLQEIEQVPHIEQTCLYRRTRTGDTQHARIEAFEGVRNLGTGGFIFLCFVSDDNGPMAGHTSKGMLIIGDRFIVRQDDTIVP